MDEAPQKVAPCPRCGSVKVVATKIGDLWFDSGELHRKYNDGSRPTWVVRCRCGLTRIDLTVKYDCLFSTGRKLIDPLKTERIAQGAIRKSS